MSAPFAPMMAVPVTSTDEVAGPGWMHEFKWDGIRVLAEATGDGVRLWSRNGNEVTVAWPELAGLAQLVPPGTVLDGEIVVLDPEGRPSFSLVASRMHVRNPGRVETLRAVAPGRLMTFDLLSEGDHPLLSVPLEDRRGRLAALVPNATGWAVPPASEDLDAILAVVRQRGMEGIVSKRLGSVYEPGRRSRSWRKLRVVHEIDAIVVGFRRVDGAASGPVGSLALARRDDTGWLAIGSVGSGIGPSEGQRLLEVLEPVAPLADEVLVPPEFTPVPPRIVVRVSYLEVTPGGQLRHPVYKGQRDDVTVDEVTDVP